MKLLKQIRSYFRIKYDSWRQKRNLKLQARAINRAKKYADEKHALDGRRYYVLTDWKGDYRVVNKREVSTLKRLGVMSKKVNHKVLLEEAVYWTK